MIVIRSLLLIIFSFWVCRNFAQEGENQKENLPGINSEGLKTAPARTNYNKVLAEALRLQLKADSAARIARDLRIMVKEMPGDSLNKQRTADILKNEQLAKRLQKQADEKFAEARKIKAPIDTEADSVLQFSREINGIKIYQYRPDKSNDTVITCHDFTKSENNEVNDETIKPVTRSKSDQFSIQDKSPYSASNPIPQGLEHDTGLTYRVQLGVFSQTRPDDAFGGINPVAYEYVPGTSRVKYYAGLFYSLNSVIKALEIIRSLGFPDAFIVAFENGRPITTERAREIEFAGFKL